MAYGNFVPRLFYVRNMFFFSLVELGFLGCLAAMFSLKVSPWKFRGVPDPSPRHWNLLQAAKKQCGRPSAYANIRR
jgi:hypothetical protein